MRRKLFRTIVLVPVALILSIGVASALDQTNGSGLTHEGASLGFNAKGDLRGNITYTSHDGTGFQVMCRDGLTKYVNQPPSPSGALRTRVTANCTDQNGDPIYVEIYFIDRGEPGDRDSERIFFTYDPDHALDADSDPNVLLMKCNSGVEVTLGCNDTGIITAGNVQIHQSSNPAKQTTVVIGEKKAAA
jgi:hypothetical protein